MHKDQGLNYLSRASISERRRVIKDLLTQWGAAITRKEGDAFEAEWFLVGEALTTPPKKRRKRHDVCLADADGADAGVDDADVDAVAETAAVAGACG